MSRIACAGFLAGASRRRGAIIVGLLVMMSVACSKEAPSSSTPQVQTDLVELGKFVRLPKGITRARWLVRPVHPGGSSRLPGPTDVILFAYLDVSPEFWVDQGSSFGQRTPATRRLKVSEARALLPPALFATSRPDGGDYVVPCEKLDGTVLSTPIHKVSASRCGDGLLVSVFLN